jgi:hypothetical protein
MAGAIANILDIAAWKRKDLHGIAKLIHCDIELTSPFAKVSGSESFLAAVQKTSASRRRHPSARQIR